MKKIIFAFLSLFFILPAAVACDSYRTGADGVSYGCNKGNNVGGGGIVLLEFPRASKCNKGGFLKCSNFSDMDTHYCTGWSASDFNPSMHEPVSSNSDGTSKNACWQWQCKKNANGDKMVFMPGSQTSCIPATVAAQQTKCDGLATNPPTQAMLNGRCIPICGIDSTTKTQTADTTFVKIGGNLGGGSDKCR